MMAYNKIRTVIVLANPHRSKTIDSSIVASLRAIYTNITSCIWTFTSVTVYLSVYGKLLVSWHLQWFRCWKRVINILNSCMLNIFNLYVSHVSLHSYCIMTSVLFGTGTPTLFNVNIPKDQWYWRYWSTATYYKSKRCSVHCAKFWLQL